MNTSQKLQVLVILSLILCFGSCLKFPPIIEIDEKDFFNQTSIKYDSEVGKLKSEQNALVYFFVQGQQKNQQVLNQRAQFESARYSYLKTLHQDVNKEKQATTQIIDEEDRIDDEISHPIGQQSSSQQHKSYSFYLEFYIVKCQQETSSVSQTQSICSILSISQQNKKSLIVLLTQNSQLVSFVGQIKEENLIYFISKVKENYMPQTKMIVFDEELNKIAIKLQIDSQTIKQKTFGFFQGLTRYLTWDALKFFIVFFVVPFVFGYVSTKLQQRANRQKFRKYQANLEQDQKPTQNSSTKLTNESKEKSS